MWGGGPCDPPPPPALPQPCVDVDFDGVMLAELAVAEAAALKAAAPMAAAPEAVAAAAKAQKKEHKAARKAARKAAAEVAAAETAAAEAAAAETAAAKAQKKERKAARRAAHKAAAAEAAAPEPAVAEATEAQKAHKAESAEVMTHEMALASVAAVSKLAKSEAASSAAMDVAVNAAEQQDGELGDRLAALVTENDIGICRRPVAQKRSNSGVVDCGAARLAEMLGCARLTKTVVQPPREPVEEARTIIAPHVVDFLVKCSHPIADVLHGSVDRGVDGHISAGAFASLQMAPEAVSHFWNTQKWGSWCSRNRSRNYCSFQRSTVPPRPDRCAKPECGGAITPESLECIVSASFVAAHAVVECMRATTDRTATRPDRSVASRGSVGPARKLGCGLSCDNPWLVVSHCNGSGGE